MVQPFQRPLLLLTRSAELEANIRTVIQRPFFVHVVQDWPALKATLLSAPATTVCFADGMTAVGRHLGLAEGLRDISRDFPLVAVVACLQLGAQGRDTVEALQEWGVADILDLDRERSALAVARRLSLVEGVWAERLLRRALPRTLSARGRAVLETVAHVAARGGHVPELAAELGIYRRTAARWAARAGVPEPRRMFAWVRLLLAADLLDNPARTIESVARVTGFSSAATLKTSYRRFTGHSPSELREMGAFETVANLARAEFRSAREAARQSSSHRNSWLN